MLQTAESNRRTRSESMLIGLLDDRRIAAALVAATGLHLLLGGVLHVPLFVCPFHTVTGLPCPGCGLSRALLSLASGHWAAALRFHPFAPYFLALAALLALAAALPSRLRTLLVTRVVALEHRTRLHALALTGFVLFGVVRLAWCVAQRW
jgi:hypothetical protein